MAFQFESQTASSYHAFPPSARLVTPTPAQTQAVDFSTTIAHHQARQQRAFSYINPSIANPSNISAQSFPLSNWNNTAPSGQQRTIAPPSLYHSNSTGHPPASTMTLDMNELEATAAGFAESQMDFDTLLSVDDMAALHGFQVNLDPAPSATVSPQDVFIDYDLSAPNSNALTDLTTPSMYDDSPYEVSPAFGTADIDSQNWAPLFGNSDMFGSSTVNHYEPLSLTASASSAGQQATSMVRTESSSSTGEKDIVLQQRLSVTAGINKASRRTLKDLPPIHVDDEDDKAVKRARNTMAARKSRQKKRDTEDLLRIALDAMTADRDHWKLVAIQHGAPLPKP